jgi:putative DNA primase/helicase
LLGQQFGLDRDAAKVCDLAYQYQGGIGAYRNLAPDDDASSDDLIKARQKAWRQAHPQIGQFWRALNRAAVLAVRHPGHMIPCNALVNFRYEGDFLKMRLPSGRDLSYPFPQTITDGYGSPAISFKDNQGGKWVDCRFGQDAYPGIWAENVTSAVARDILVAAMPRLEAAGYRIVMTVHDEICAEVPDGFGSIEEFKKLLLVLPPWAQGLPIAAKVRNGARFAKTSKSEAVQSEQTPITPEDHPLQQPATLLTPEELAPAELELGSAEDIKEATESELERDSEESVELELDDDPLADLLQEISDFCPESASSPNPRPAAKQQASETATGAFFKPPPMQTTPHEAPPEHCDGDSGCNAQAPTGEEDASSSQADEDEQSQSSGQHNGYYSDKKPWGGALAIYIYRNQRGEPHLKITRTKAKQFPQAFRANGQWLSKKPAGWVNLPYRLCELIAAASTEPVFIPEGEKDALNLAALGLIATCNPGGAGKWQPELARWFKGKQTAYILEDNDAPGRAHVAKVASALHGIIPDIRIVSFPELPEHGDVSDWLAAGHTREQLLERAKAAPKFDKPVQALQSARASSFDLSAVQWIWPGRFAVGKLGLIAGLPDEGKGQILCDIAARITRGLPWPCEEGQAPRGNVILLTAEDDIEDTVAPRLVAAGADLECIEIIRMVRDQDKDRMFSLITDLELLRQKIVEIGNVRTIQIDPVSAYFGIGKMDSYRTPDVRAVLGPVTELARELKVLILGIMHFNKKTDVTNVLLRISDSLAFGATSRHVYAVVNDTEHGRKLFVKGKNNLAPADQKALAYSFGTRQVGTDAKSGELIWAPHIVWQPEHIDVTATEAMQAAAECKSPAARDTAKSFLEEMLSNGPVTKAEIEEAAEANGIAARTLHRAKAQLKVQAVKDGPMKDGQRTWRWHLAST